MMPSRDEVNETELHAQQSATVSDNFCTYGTVMIIWIHWTRQADSRMAPMNLGWLAALVYQLFFGGKTRLTCSLLDSVLPPVWKRTFLGYWCGFSQDWWPNQQCQNTEGNSKRTDPNQDELPACFVLSNGFMRKRRLRYHFAGCWLCNSCTLLKTNTHLTASFPGKPG